MSNDYQSFEKRKQDHIELALMPVNQAHECNLLDKVSLQHEALPDLDFNNLSINTARFGHAVNTPFIVSSMTAGHDQAATINRNLLAACAQSSWAMGVGSQRRELTDPLAHQTWRPLLCDYPSVTLFSNIGIAQLLHTPLYDLQKLSDALNARAFIVHCNPLQECIQPEGTPQFTGAWHALESMVKFLQLPIIVKETGCGFAKPTLERLNNIGIAAVDVSGLGGTHWGRIEGHRAIHDPLRFKAANTFRQWGVSTVESVMTAHALQPNFEIWGSGGVRNGLDAAKLIALGASTIGFAKPLLKSALIGPEAVYSAMMSIEYELKVAMFCTGSATIHDLKEKACLL